MRTVRPFARFVEDERTKRTVQHLRDLAVASNAGLVQLRIAAQVIVDKLPEVDIRPFPGCRVAQRESARARAPRSSWRPVCSRSPWSSAGSHETRRTSGAHIAATSHNAMRHPGCVGSYAGRQPRTDVRSQTSGAPRVGRRVRSRAAATARATSVRTLCGGTRPRHVGC